MDGLHDEVEEICEEAYIVEDDGEPSFSTNIIELEHSFGYDCKRLFNLVLVDNDTLIFASGNYLHYLSISRREVTFRQSVFGHGFGFIAKNEDPTYQGLFTVGENGPTPTVFIYEYPTHNVRYQLLNAAKSCFTAGSYNSSGELFASQAGYPDFMLTIWRWEKGEVVLRSKSFQSDILYVHFSVFNPILLVSSGVSHIKFWKMANTFTGLKLKGDLGRFGKTDFSDIYATYMLPDENVISGCEWGNMLLWEAGLIKFEICRKSRKPCHSMPITSISYNDGEVTTVGMDGYVRIWFWESVDLADPPEDDLFVEIEPIYEFKIADVEIRAMQKIYPFEQSDSTYYAQDGKGGIWLCDLNMNDLPKEPKKIYSCVGGPVVAAETSPVSPHILTMSRDGKIFAYDYSTKKLLLEKQFSSNGVDLLWFSTEISPNGMEVVAGFEDGIIRQLYLEPYQKIPKLHLICAIKAHTAPLTKLTVNKTNTYLVTGAVDKSIFIYRLLHKNEKLVELCPLGFVELKGIPNCFYWHDEEPTMLLIGCKAGEVYECNLRIDVTDEDTYLSYNLTTKDKIRMTSFISVKSRIRRDIKRAHIKRRKEWKRQRKINEIEKLKKANPGLQIDLESALADSEPDEDEDPLYIPQVPSTVLWIRYTEQSTIWVTMSGYDAGYTYELEFGALEPSKCTLIKDCDDMEIHSYLIIEEYFIFGLINGQLRINRINPNNFRDFSEYRVYPMHDMLKGKISRILSTFDGNHIISVGFDGNIFLYKWLGPVIEKNPLIDKPLPAPVIELTEDIIDPEFPSLEQEKINAEIRRQEDAAAAHDRSVMDKIVQLQKEYFNVINMNNTLPVDLHATDRELLIDERITKQIRAELQSELNDVREDLAYDLEFVQVGHTKLLEHFLKGLDHVPFKVSAIRSDDILFSFRLESLGKEHQQIKHEIEERLRQEKKLGCTQKLMELDSTEVLQDLIFAEEKEDSIGEPPIETFFFGRDSRSITSRFSKKMMRLLIRYRKRQLYEIKRIFDWDKLERQKPDPNRNYPDDDAKIQEAQRNLGDFKLKIGTEYEPKSTDTLTYKYIEIVQCRERLYNIINSFNQEVLLLRSRKNKFYEYFNKKRNKLKNIHDVLPYVCRRKVIYTREFNVNYEYPELNLVEHCVPGCGIDIDDILYLEMDLEEALKSKQPTELNPILMQWKEKLRPQEESARCYFQIEKIKMLPSLEELIKQVESQPQAMDIVYYEIDSQGNSPLLVEARYRCLISLILEQEFVIRSIDESVRTFDQDFKKMTEKRYNVKLEAEFMATYMISLNQELLILRDSEEIETQLLLNANVAMNTRNDLQLVINATNRQLDDLRKNIDKVQDQIVGLHLKFMSTIKGHKFYDFLRRIFKKKWKPAKPPKKDDESSESSSSDSSSSEDEAADTKSIDSLDMTTIRLDESTCPSGLERSLYELSFKMRSDRHAFERAVLENQIDVDNKRKEIAEMQKDMKFHEEVYARERNTLIEFRRQRQREINKVEMNVVLRMDQLQHFYESDDFRDLSNAVLFDANKLVELRRRVEQLNDETIATKRWHRVNIVHLKRMSSDIKFMRYEITRLEEEIRLAMMKRFGLVINMDELEEEVLRSYVFELETTAEDELRIIEKELREKEWELAHCEEKLVKETQLNSEKLNILSVLLEEKNTLCNILNLQDNNFVKWTKLYSFNVAMDIEKLIRVNKKQRSQIECLEREICTLRLKSKPLQRNEELGRNVPFKGDIIDSQQLYSSTINIDAYMVPPLPDDFIMDRIQTLVQKTFMRLFGTRMTNEKVRCLALRAAVYMSQAAFSFEGNMTDSIQECIMEQLKTIVPKKYFIHVGVDELRKLFNEVIIIFDYERSDINTEEVILGIFEHAKDALCDKLGNIINRTQFIVSHMFKELIEVLPLEEFQSEGTHRMIANVLEREPLVDPRSIDIEEVIISTVQHARENLLDGITAVPVRRLASAMQKDLISRRQYKMPKCSQSSISDNIPKKHVGNIF